mgnify:CR=1 FL=1
MSAFVVEDVTINRIVTRLCNDRDADYTKRRLADEVHVHSAAHLGQALFGLNVVAVNARYGAGEAEKFRPLDYRYSPDPASTSRIQALKSLRSWLYQCTEGMAPETPLYQIMDDYSHSLAMQIIRDLPAYEAAVWD